MEVDLDAAAAEGIISEDQAIALRSFEARRADESLSMAEKFQIFGGLTDIVAAAGLALTLVAAGAILHDAELTGLYLALPFVAFLVRNRIRPRHKPCVTAVLLVGSLAALALGLPTQWYMSSHIPPDRLVFVLAGLIPALVYAVAFWRWSRFPPAPAAMATILVLGLAAAFVPEFGSVDANSRAPFNAALVAGGFAALLWGVWWDLTDVRRETERSQIAFWLHCCAGFFISRGAYALVTGHGALEENFALGLGADHAAAFVLIFGLSVLVSLVLDRRSLMIGSIMPTITFFGNIGSEVYGMLFAGASLLVFTYFWNAWRRAVLKLLPARIAAQLPRPDVVHHGQRPTRRHLELLPRRWR